MWGEETWLTQAKASVRQTIRSLSIEGLLALSYAVVSGFVNVSEVKDLFQDPRSHGAVAVFNLNPIEARARAQYQAGTDERQWDQAAPRRGKRRDR